MTAAQLESPVREGVRSLEVRWIFPGQLKTAVAGWFGRFPAGVESREDTYLLSPDLPGLSVKVRGYRALEVKVYGGSRGVLDVAGRARGRLESWQKWSFPFSRLSPGSAAAAGWRPVHKRRRISQFSQGDSRIRACGPGPGEEPVCEVELTEIRTCGEAWWTLGFEATGPARLLSSELQATAAIVFAQALPGGMKPGTDDSTSYAEWLYRRLGAEMSAARAPSPSGAWPRRDSGQPEFLVAEAVESSPELAADRHLQAVCNLIGSWSVNSARDLAWNKSLLLWQVRGDPIARGLLCDSLAASTAMASRMLLIAL